MSLLDKVVLGVSCLSALLSLLSFLLFWRVWSHQRIVLSMSMDVQRFARIEESVVRSVMEEGGDYSVEAKLRTVERLRATGLPPSAAVAEAQRLHKRKVSG